MRERLIVIGGDAGGMTAASQARKLRGPDDLEILAFERGAYTSYSACGIPYLVGDLIHDAARLIVRSPETFRSAQSIQVQTHHEVVEIDPAAAHVVVRDLREQTDRTVSFDHLMVATGSTPVRPDLPSIGTAGIFGVQTLEDGIALRRAVDERAPSSAVVVGAGYIGLEIAEALTMRGLTVTVVEAADQPMRTLDEDMGALVAEAMQDAGIVVRTGESVSGFEQRDGWIASVATEARTIPADLVVLGLGSRPNADLAAAAGLPVGPTGGVVTDERMAVSEQIWAAGDCVQTTHRVTGAPVAIALGTHANKQGRVAGINIGGGTATFPGVIGTAVTRVCSLEIGRTGLTAAEAAAAGIEHDSVTIGSRTRARYYPGAERIRVKLVYRSGDGLLLGGQVLGHEGVAKRTDVIATAVWNEMTVDEVQMMDLSYAPPFSPVWDPVVYAARAATARRAGREEGA